MFQTILELARHDPLFTFFVLLLLCKFLGHVIEVVVPWSRYNCQGYLTVAKARDDDDNNDTVDLQP